MSHMPNQINTLTVDTLANGNELAIYNGLPAMRVVPFEPAELVPPQRTAERLGRGFEGARIIGDLAIGGISDRANQSLLLLVDMGKSHDNYLGLVNGDYKADDESSMGNIAFVEPNVQLAIGRMGDTSQAFNDRLSPYVSKIHVSIGNLVTSGGNRIITVTGQKAMNYTRLRHARKPQDS
jgi:hypothetical protein